MRHVHMFVGLCVVIAVVGGLFQLRFSLASAAEPYDSPLQVEDWVRIPSDGFTNTYLYRVYDKRTKTTCYVTITNSNSSSVACR